MVKKIENKKTKGKKSKERKSKRVKRNSRNKKTKKGGFLYRWVSTHDPEQPEDITGYQKSALEQDLERKVQECKKMSAEHDTLIQKYKTIEAERADALQKNFSLKQSEVEATSKRQRAEARLWNFKQEMDRIQSSLEAAEEREKELEKVIEAALEREQELEKVIERKHIDYLETKPLIIKDYDTVNKHAEERQDIPSDILRELQDPITSNIMTDPVITTSGRTFDRTSINDYITRLRREDRKPSDPFSGGIEIDPNILIPNMAVRSLIEKYFHTTTGGRRKLTKKKKSKKSRKFRKR